MLFGISGVGEVRGLGLKGVNLFGLGFVVLAFGLWDKMLLSCFGGIVAERPRGVAW